MSARQAARLVDLAHEQAARSGDDPVEFMRGRLAEAEERFWRTGMHRHLLVVRAFEASLGPAKSGQPVVVLR